MKILYYDLLKGVTGTHSNHIQEIINNMENHGITFFFITTNSQDNNRQVPGKSTILSKIRISARWPGLGIFLSLIGEIRIFIRGIIALNKIDNKPDIVYFRHGLFNAGLWTAKVLKVPAVKEVNGIVANEMQISNLARGVTLKLINRIETRSMPHADRIIVVTSKLKDLLIKEYNVTENKIEVMENGANVELFKPMDKSRIKNKLGLDDQFQYVCFVGNFAAWQGLEYLIKSIPLVLKECSSARFLLVGDGDLKAHLEDIAKDSGVLDKVIFTGMVPYQKVPYYINASDVCVAPFISQRNERIGLSPLKLCEYLACEKPVIASRISGLEILEEYQMGLLVSPEDEFALAEAIVKLLKDASLSEIMGKNGRQFVVQHRSWESIAKKTVQIFEDLRNQKCQKFY